jgi:hypothetical protein
MRLKTCLGRSYRGLSIQFKNIGIVGGSLTGFQNALEKCLHAVKRICKGLLRVLAGVKPKDSNQVSVGATQSVLLLQF